jgi:hypothetical protein
MRTFFGVLLLFISANTTAEANPPPTISFLMNEPVTMFDRGMDRIRDELTQLRRQYLDKDQGKICVYDGCIQLPDDVELMGVFPDYEFDKGRLTLTLMTKSRYEKSKSESDLQNKCAAALNVFQQNVLSHVFSVPALPARAPHQPWMIERIIGYLSGWFSHHDFDRSGRPSDIGETILKVLRLEVITNGGDHPYAWYRCSTPLVGDSVTLTPPFDAARLVKDQLARCFSKPKQALDRSVQLMISVSQSGKIDTAGTFVYPKSNDLATGQVSEETLREGVSSWTAALERAAHDPKCQPLNLPQDRWPDWKDITIDYEPQRHSQDLSPRSH